MVQCCIVFGCNSWRKPKGTVSFFRFPNEIPRGKMLSVKLNELAKRRRAAWCKILKHPDYTEAKLLRKRVCSLHFVKGKPAKLEDTEDPDWLPSIDIPILMDVEPDIETLIESSENFAVTTCNTNTHNQSEQFVDEVFEQTEEESAVHDVQQQADIVTAVDDSHQQTAEVPESSNHELGDSSSTNSSVTTLIAPLLELQNQNGTTEAQALIIPLLKELQHRTNEVHHLRSVTDKLTMKEMAFQGKDKDQKIKFFTGLPSFDLFKLIENRISDSLSLIQCSNVDNFQKLLLTLMRMRSNISFQDLAYRFGLRNRAVSNIFKKVVLLLYTTFQSLIYWPDRECLKLNVPRSFQMRFGDKVAVIIDCFEVATERPSVLKSRNQSFSNYKQKHTLKYLIGITPQGVISFISDGYGGRVSDKVITEGCGILDEMRAGDIVLADRGFTVSEILNSREVKLLSPAFKGTQDQMSPVDIENSRNISAVRIHIERVIGEIRQKYRILGGPVPISLLKCKHNNALLFDYIVKVACILINLCDSIVSGT